MINIDLLKKQKQKLKLTFDDLEKISGVPKRTLANIFLGKTKHPRIDTMQAIEKALGIENEPAEISESNKNLLELLSQLTDEEVDELSNYIDFIISKRK